MSKHSFSQLISEILSQIQGARAQVYKHTPSPSNAGVEQNFLTYPGGPTLADFFVAPPQGSFDYAFVVAPRNQTQGRSLQLRKKSV